MHYEHNESHHISQQLHVRTFPPPDRASAVDAAGRAGFGPHCARPRGNASPPPSRSPTSEPGPRRITRATLWASRPQPTARACAAVSRSSRATPRPRGSGSNPPSRAAADCVWWRRPWAARFCDCGSPLPLWNAPAPAESGRGLPQSKTLSRWSPLLCRAWGMKRCRDWHGFGGGQAGAVHASGPDGGILRERGWGAAGLRHRISAPQPSTLNSQPVSGGFAGGAGAERGAGRGDGWRRQAQAGGLGARAGLQPPAGGGCHGPGTDGALGSALGRPAGRERGRCQRHLPRAH